MGDRQRACPRPDCQAERRKRGQAVWRKRHPEYAMAWRISRRAANVAGGLGIVDAHPELPRAEMRAMRNVVVHEYFGVTSETLWTREDLPAIIEPLRALLASSGSSRGGCRGRPPGETGCNGPHRAAPAAAD